jgi:hypothetical protein
MAKTNYTKVDAVLTQSLRKMAVDQLFEESSKKENSSSPPLSKQKRQLLSSLKRNLKRFPTKTHEKLYELLELKRLDLKKKIEDSDSLTQEDWLFLESVATKIENYKQELLKQKPETENSSLVETERVKHINKRFNVNEKWLPLH